MAAPTNLPILLTWLRIVAIPLFVAVLYFPEDWLSERQANVISMWIFILAAITDWLIDSASRWVGQPLTAIATGGDAGLIVSLCRNHLIHNPLLTMEGLRLIDERNA